jgi:hypothetical protein
VTSMCRTLDKAIDEYWDARECHVSDLPAPCPECGGDGEFEEAGSGRVSRCTFCGGTGEVESEEAIGLRDLEERSGDDESAARGIDNARATRAYLSSAPSTAALTLAADFLDPDSSPPRMTNREAAAALRSAIAKATAGQS